MGTLGSKGIDVSDGPLSSPAFKSQQIRQCDGLDSARDMVEEMSARLSASMIEKFMPVIRSSRSPLSQNL